MASHEPAGDPLLRSVDAVVMSVPDLESGISFYCGRLGHHLIWRNDEIGQAGLACPQSETEIVLSTALRSEPNWLVRDAAAAAELVREAGGRMLEPLIEIPVGTVAIVEDPFGNRLTLIDLSKGRYQTDDRGHVTDVLPKD